MHSFINIVILLFGILNFNTIIAQEIVGSVVDENDKPLQGVLVYWTGETEGSVTKENGAFQLARKSNHQLLIISNPGSENDTLLIPQAQTFVYIKIKQQIQLEGVEIVEQKSSNHFSLINPINIETLEKKEFKKAACCSLAESFTTSNTVDLSYANAVAGNREIQFLGLRGLYTHQLIENRPAFQGITASLGYDLIPGTWLDQINIQKGASTSIYGAQSMAGAINIGLKKPDKDHRFYANAFADAHGRSEANLHINHSWSVEDHSGLYIHASNHLGKRDHNRDGFADDPTLQRYNALWRNIFYGQRWEGQVNLQAYLDKRNGGQLKSERPYEIDQTTKGINLFGNLGFVGFKNPLLTFGSIYDIHLNEIKGQYGVQDLSATELRIAMQWMLQQKSENEKHDGTLSLSYNMNSASERFSNNLADYNEIIPGIVAEYTFKNKTEGNHQFSIGANQRLDAVVQYFDRVKYLYLPRINMRYGPNEQWTLRASAGRGYRLPRVFTNQMNLMAASKIWVNNFYDDRMEISWNVGGNITGKPFLFNKEFTINLDAYYTWFEKQLVLDMDLNDRQINIYNLDGKSSAFQALLTLSYPVLPYLQFKLGGKYTKSVTDFRSGRRDLIFIPTWRGLASIDFESKNKKWLINYTVNYTGSMPLPIKTSYPQALIKHHASEADPYILMQTQINYILKKWEFYIGAENIGDFVQHNAIIDPANPFGQYFNATEVYAPVAGFKPFIGIRYKWK